MESYKNLHLRCQIQCGLRRTAEKCKSEYPKAHDVIMNDMYVDDCLSGDPSWDETLKIADELKLALEKGGFSLKGFTFSGMTLLKT